MWNPVKSTPVIGYLYLLLTLVSGVYIYSQYKNSPDLFATLLIGIVPQLIIAYGLIKVKLWGVYGLGLLAVLTLATMLMKVYLGETLQIESVILFVVFGGLFFWLYSAKNKFTSK